MFTKSFIVPVTMSQDIWGKGTFCFNPSALFWPIVSSILYNTKDMLVHLSVNNSLRGVEQALCRGVMNWLFESGWGCRTGESVEGSRQKKQLVKVGGVPRRKSVPPVLTSYGDGSSHIVKYSGGWAGWGIKSKAGRACTPEDHPDGLWPFFRHFR